MPSKSSSVSLWDFLYKYLILWGYDKKQMNLYLLSFFALLGLVFLLVFFVFFRKIVWFFFLYHHRSQYRYDSMNRSVSGDYLFLRGVVSFLTPFIIGSTLLRELRVELERFRRYFLVFRDLILILLERVSFLELRELFSFLEWRYYDIWGGDSVFFLSWNL